MEYVILLSLTSILCGIAIVSNLVFTRHAIRTIRREGVENMITENAGLVHATSFILHILAAPAMLYTLYSPVRVIMFQTKLVEVFSQD